MEAGQHFVGMTEIRDAIGVLGLETLEVHPVAMDHVHILVADHIVTIVPASAGVEIDGHGATP